MQKRLKFLEIYLISLKEKRAKKIIFDDKVTVITGNSGKVDNDVGKSTIVKNLFYTLGAEVYFEKQWLKANPLSILKFSYGEEIFYMLRNKREFSLFNEKLELIKKFNSVTKELTPYFSEKFNFNLTLTNQSGEISPAPPVFSFLPFYIDQDRGWRDSFSSFERLGQYPKNDWKRKIIDFHTGIRPSEYYKIASEKRKTTLDRANEEKELEFLRTIKIKVSGKFGAVNLGVNPQDFKEEIEDLLKEINILGESLNDDKQKLILLYNQKSLKEEELRIISLSLRELEKDLDFATNEVVESEIECPLCGTIHNNDFRSKFSLEVDKEESQELLIEVREEISKIEKEISLIEKTLNPKEKRFEQMNNILNKKRGEVKLSELIQNEGKINLLSSIKDEIKLQEEKVEKLRTREKELQDQMDNISSKEKRESILSNYAKRMGEYLKELSVELDEEDYKNAYGNIPLGGNRKIRALLAYFYSLLSLIEEGTTSTIFPIVIDSPHQQEPGSELKKDILEFIKAHTPNSCQLIISLVDTQNVNFGGKVIALKDRLNLLNTQDYKELYPLLNRFLKQLNDFSSGISSSSPVYPR